MAMVEHSAFDECGGFLGEITPKCSSLPGIDIRIELNQNNANSQTFLSILLKKWLLISISYHQEVYQSSICGFKMILKVWCKPGLGNG
jgi:hypothetical protein